LFKSQQKQNAIHTNLNTFIPDYKKPPMQPLNTFIDKDLSADKILEYHVNPNHIRKRTNFEFDIVQESSPKTSTFTKSYGTHHFFGSGSLLQTLKQDVKYYLF
jgi:hypothetical protein